VDFEIFRKRVDPGLYVYIRSGKTNTESIYSVGYSFLQRISKNSARAAYKTKVNEADTVWMNSDFEPRVYSDYDGDVWSTFSKDDCCMGW